MNQTIYRAASVSTIALLVILGSTACAATAKTSTPVEKTVVTPKKKVHSKSEVTATAEAFFTTIEAETKIQLGKSMANPSAKPENDTKKLLKTFDKAYPMTYGMLDSKISKDTARPIIAIYSFVFMMPVDTVVSVDPEFVKIKGDTATIDSKGLIVTYNGEEIPKIEDDKTHAKDAIKLKYKAGNWVITGFGENKYGKEMREKGSFTVNTGPFTIKS